MAKQTIVVIGGLTNERLRPDSINSVYILKLITRLYERMSWNVSLEADNILDNYLQVSIIGWACKYGLDHCVQQTVKQFADWRKAVATGGHNPIVYCTAIEFGSESDWDFLWQQYLNASVASEKDKLLRALACSREPWLLSRYIFRAFNGTSGIRKQDSSFVFRSVASNNFGRDIAYNYLRDKWNVIVKYFGKSFFSFGNLVKAVTSSLNTEFELEQLQHFYEDVRANVGTAQRSFMQAIEQTKANVQWMRSHYNQIEGWLSHRMDRQDSQDWQDSHLHR